MSLPPAADLLHPIAVGFHLLTYVPYFAWERLPLLDTVMNVATMATGGFVMNDVGVRELKNRLTHYLRLACQGDKIIVTARGKPLAILHSVESIEESAGLEERLVSLAAKGL